MPGEPNNTEAIKPNPNKEQQVTQGLPEKQEPQTQPATDIIQGILNLPIIPPPTPTAPNASTTAATPETKAHAGDVVLSQPATATETKAHAGNVQLSQLPAEVEVALAAVGRGVSVEVNVSSCPGVCGGRVRGLRLSPVEYLALVYLRDVLGYSSFCDVLRDPRFGGLFCGGGRRGRAVVGGVEQLLGLVKLLKELGRVESREGPYAAGYLVKRLLDGVPYYEFVDYLRRKVMGRVVSGLLQRLLSGGLVSIVGLDFLAQVADGLLVYFTRELGFDNAYDLARYLQAAVKVVEPRFTARHGGYRDVGGLVCSDGVVFSTMEPVLRVFWRLVWHLKHDHGLVSLDDVVEEAEVGRDRVNFILTNMRGLESLMGWLSGGIEARGLVKDGVCTLCGGEVGSDPFAVILHFVNWHREQAESLFRNLGQQQVQEPQALDLLEDAAREVAQRTGIDYELALGVVKTVHSIVNVEGTLNVDEVRLHMNFYDPALTTKLVGLDVGLLILAAKEALDARGLIDVRVKEKAQSEAKPEPEPQTSEPEAGQSEVKAEAETGQSEPPKPEEPRSSGEEPKPEAGAKESEAKPDGAHSSGPQPEAKDVDQPEAECRPEDIGANSLDPYSIVYMLACELYRLYGKPGIYITLAEMLLKDIKKGCSEKHLEKLGYGNVRILIKALKKLKLC